MRIEENFVLIFPNHIEGRNIKFWIYYRYHLVNWYEIVFLWQLYNVEYKCYIKSNLTWSMLKC